VVRARVRVWIPHGLAAQSQQPGRARHVDAPDHGIAYPPRGDRRNRPLPDRQASGSPFDRTRSRASDRLASLAPTITIDAIYSRPLERARETAASLARSFRIGVQIDDGLKEVDFGEWTGLTFDVLNARME
jgi:probable phosphoglycerate mutase